MEDLNLSETEIREAAKVEIRNLLRRIVAAKTEASEKGYAVIRDVFPKTMVAAIKSNAYDIIKNPLKDAGQLQKNKNGTPALLFWPQDLNPFLKSVAHSLRMQLIAQTFLGPKVRQLNNQIYFREANDGDEFGWHQDICFRTPPEEFQNIESGYLQTVIAVDRVHDGNGAVEFIPGSHLLGERRDLVPRDNSEKGLRTFKRGEFKGHKVNAEAGDVIVWHVLAIHGSEKNVSDSSRMLYMNGFAREDAVLNKSKFPVYPIDEKTKGLGHHHSAGGPISHSSHK